MTQHNHDFTSGNSSDSQPFASNQPMSRWLVVVIVAVVLAISWWQKHQGPATDRTARQATPTDSSQSRSAIPNDAQGESDAPIEPVVAADDAKIPSVDGLHHDSHAFKSHGRAPHEAKPTESGISPKSTDSEKRSSHSGQSGDPLKIEDQVIRDQQGAVVYRGLIDLRPTLDRIANGEKNSHRNDGTTFQNRERHLPAKPMGYYTEYVQPTKGISGPGPQRVIIGKDGDVWYTPDHYRSFQRIE